MKRKVITLFIIIFFILLNNSNIFAKSEIQGTFYIDSPTINIFEGKKIKIVGWYLSNDAGATMKISIDDEDTNAKVEARIEREDVFRVISGYGGRELNPKPGFEMTIDLSKYSYGEHTIKYELIDSDGSTIAKETRKVTIDNRSKGKFSIDNQTGNIIEGKSKKIIGWYLSNDIGATMKISIDDEDTNAKVEARIEREDVFRVISGYGGRELNPKPGFEMTIDLSKYSYGEHTIKYELIDSDGSTIAKEIRKVTIDSRSKGIFSIDNPTDKTLIECEKLKIEGWYLSNDANSTIKIYIDGIDTKVNINRSIEREDVFKAISGYGGRELNTKPGFECIIDISSYAKGEHHKIRYELIDGDNNVIKSMQYDKVFYSSDKGTLCLDYPKENSSSGNNIKFIGWEMSQNVNSTIKIYLNGQEIDSKIIRGERQDVLDVISGYGGKEKNPQPGFETTISMKDYNEGTYKFEVMLFSQEGKLLDCQKRNIVIVKNFGIDVSKWQGDIDWNKTSQQINYAIIRVGYGWSSKNKDVKFVNNYNSCTKNGIPVGVYTYSYATNIEEVELEAYAVLNWLEGRKLELPIFWDTEDDCQKNIDKKTLTEMANRFCKIITEHGYNAGIYASKNWLEKKLDMTELENKYDVWVAQYNTSCTYSGRYDIWQYTSQNYIQGIEGVVDCNWFYKKY